MSTHNICFQKELKIYVDNPLILNSDYIFFRFKAQLRDKLDESVLPAFELLLVGMIL